MTFHGLVSVLVRKAKTGETVQCAKLKPNLLTNNGRDGMHQLVYTNASGTTRAFYAIGLTETAITPADTDTTLTGEIVTNGLIRVDAGTHTHTTGTNTSLVEHTFTATGAFTDVKASATFNATSSGTMAHIATFATGSGTLATNDTLKVSWTFTLDD